MVEMVVVNEGGVVLAGRLPAQVLTVVGQPRDTRTSAI